MSDRRAWKTMERALAVSFVALLPNSLALRAEPAVESPAAGDTAPVDAPLSLSAARERAKLMHTIYASTLEALHHHYFHGDRAVVPARAMESIFADVARTSKTTARWIAVSTQAMSLDHEPASEFEKHAAAEIKGGKSAVERVEKGNYLRATPIPLDSGCIRCHTGGLVTTSTAPRFAALVISMPLSE